jgi:large subunit ribosomal protein L21
MKFAVLKTGGKQYLVNEGMTLKVEKLSENDAALEVGAKITFDSVLATIEGETVKLGNPTTGSKVMAEVVSLGRHAKVTVLRYMPKSRWAKKNGHKQPYTELKILSV